MNIGNDLEIMFNNMAEVEFLRKCLISISPSPDVLEWGSGGSTLEIGKYANRLFSIEHDINWYNKVKCALEKNPTKKFHGSMVPCSDIRYVPRNQEEKPGHDGTLEDYFDYVNYPQKHIRYISNVSEYNQPLLYDLIFIDGRARVHCAEAAVQILKPGGIILIHDYRNPTEQYRRYEYEVVEEFLDVVDGEYALWAFKPKKLPLEKGGG